MENKYVDIDIRVRYAETDKFGVVYYANYFVLFELGRAEYMRQRGMPYDQLEKAGYFLLVAEASCRYRAPLRYDEEATVRTWVKKASGKAVVFAYQLFKKGEDKLVAEGETFHIVTDFKGVSCHLPEAYQKYF